ncbi:hypothetical protein [Algibacter pectinivorans]|uniref:SnoaL-like domain-containing protein n=1 Tax=Algibacter pectinivorans TaxID=870482 RepID=A0A1I1P8G8_9FLAO|nr:hypothetical protein [Algibacter pectinivorans]SFD03958.1 hypothetical protein SAMN04487987_103111 [Algibacter pectinivorans]
MKKLLILVLLSVLSINLQAQDKQKDKGEKPEKETVEFIVDSTSVLTLDKTIETLYNVISGEKDEERNWKQFKFLFSSDAKLIASGKDKEGHLKVVYMSPGDYIKSSGKWLVENGFIEKEIHRNVDVFGNIAQVFSTYECFKSKTDPAPFMRGINSIQLLNDGERWWIVNVFWSQETDKHPIPARYLN